MVPNLWRVLSAIIVRQNLDQPRLKRKLPNL
jgi:hypothetical protein